MKRILLLLTLVLFTTTITEAQKIKDINGVKIPKGYTASYDELDDIFFITQKNDIFADTHGKNSFDLRFIISLTGNTVTPYVDFKYYESENLLTESSTLYIKNKGSKIHRYNSIWESRVFGPKIDPIFEDIRYFEQITFNDDKLNNFIMENLKSTSEVTVRFHGYETFDKKLRTKYVKELASAVEFYKKILISFE